LTASVASFLTQAQKRGSELPPALSGALLLAAIRLSEHQQQALRPYQLLVDDDGALELLNGDPPTADGYAAPELRNGAALPRDPRVLVYAAGALGYELVTLTPPRLSGDSGAELAGPLAAVIRKAMGERRDRFKSLKDMALAVERVQARPTPDEERLILAAVASSTQLPAAQKLAKLELQKAAGIPEPDVASHLQAAPALSWDAMEPSAEIELPAAEPPPAAVPPPAAQPPAPGAFDDLRAQINEAKKTHEDQTARIEGLSRLGARLDALEEQVRSSMPPPVSAATALARDVKLLLDERRFAEAERALQSPLTATDATLQLRLGQTLAATGDADGSRAQKAEAAFRRASELDPAWAQPKAHLGALLLRQDKRDAALTQLRAALELDPTCAEAQQALAQAEVDAQAASRPGRRPLRFAAGALAGAAAVIAAILFLRPNLLGTRHEPESSSASATIATPPKPAPEPTPPPAQLQPATPDPGLALAPEPALPQNPDRRPEPEPEPEPTAAKAAHPDPKPRKKPSANHAAAEAAAARGDRALRSFDTNTARSAFQTALKLDPGLPSAHRGMGMVYVLLGKNPEAKAEYSRYLKLAPDAPDKDQIERLIAR